MLVVLAAAVMLHASEGFDSAQRKLDAIEARQVRPGSVVTFTPEEINAWARVTVPQIVPQGIRNEHVELSNGSAISSALVDFLKMRQGKGEATNWFLSRLIEGERPLAVTLRVQSGGGRCTVYLTGVELSGVAVNQTVLDFLVKTFFLPIYPDAKINQPFDLDYNIDRIDIRPRGVMVTIKR